MKKLFKALKAGFVSLSILSCIVLFLLMLEGTEVKSQFIKISPFLLAHFFIAPFLSFLFFEQPKGKKIGKILLGAFSTFAIVCAILYFKMNYDIKLKHPYGRVPFICIECIMNAIFSAFIYTLFTIGQIISLKSSSKKYQNFKKVKFSPKFLLIPLIGSIVYTLIINLEHHTSIVTIGIFFTLFFIGLLMSFLTVFSLNKIYKNQKKIIVIVVFYLFSNILGIVLFAILFNLYYSKGFEIAPISIPYFMFVLIISHFYFLNLLNKQEKTVLKQKSLQSQLNYQQLKNQLSPHFLFNNINVLTSLIEENPQKAIVFSEKLSNIYRYFLEQEKEDVVRLSEEISFAKDYLHLLKGRFEKGLSFSIDLSESSLQKFVTSTSLQQILENSIKHNEVSEEKELNISIRSDEEYLIISNNKNPKLSAEKSLQKGIENIRKRYAYFTDKEVVIKQNDEIFSIQLPLLTV